MVKNLGSAIVVGSLVGLSVVTGFGVHQHRVVGSRIRTTHLSMGLLDSLSSFLQQRQGDFVRLEDSESAYGPGPLLILYKVPQGIDNDEIQAMISDGAPKSYQRGVRVARIVNDNDQETAKLLDSTVEEAVNLVANGGGPKAAAATGGAMTMPNVATGCPVIYFSGFENSEMMATYNILGQEIYQETGGAATPACAKVVPNAMPKTLRQVLEEISGDHMDAMKDPQ